MDKSDFIFGIRPIIEAIKAGKIINKILIQKGLRGSLFYELQQIVQQNDVPLQQVPEEKLNRITRKNHQGVIALISPISFASIDMVLPSIFEKGKVPLILVLDKVTDVRNFGAIVRTAECTGVDAVVIPSLGAASINGDAVKTSAGALHLVPICKEWNLKDTLLFLKESGLQVVACSEKADKPYTQIDLTLPTAFVMGSEEEGVSDAYLKLTDQQVSIPLMGNIASLNVSVATGVVLYEAVKQRGLLP